MSSTRDYTDYLNDQIDIAPVNTQEELQAAELLENLFAQHGLETAIEDFRAPLAAGVGNQMMLILLFIGVFLSGFLGTVVQAVGMLVTLAAFVLIVLERQGNDVLGKIGARGNSQNVIGVHRASGPLVAKGNRTIVIVAHYDTPRESFIYSNPQLTRLYPVLCRWSFALATAAFVAAVLQLPPFIPLMARHLFWVLGVVAALPLVLLGANAVYERFAPYTTGANDNKSSLAAMLGVLDQVRPADDDAKEWAKKHPRVAHPLPVREEEAEEYADAGEDAAVDAEGFEDEVYVAEDGGESEPGYDDELEAEPSYDEAVEGEPYDDKAYDEQAADDKFASGNGYASDGECVSDEPYEEELAGEQLYDEPYDEQVYEDGYYEPQEGAWDEQPEPAAGFSLDVVKLAFAAVAEWFISLWERIALRFGFGQAGELPAADAADEPYDYGYRAPEDGYVEEGAYEAAAAEPAEEREVIPVNPTLVGPALGAEADATDNEEPEAPAELGEAATEPAAIEEHVPAELAEEAAGEHVPAEPIEAGAGEGQTNDLPEEAAPEEQALIETAAANEEAAAVEVATQNEVIAAEIHTPSVVLTPETESQLPAEEVSSTFDDAPGQADAALDATVVREALSNNVDQAETELAETTSDEPSWVVPVSQSGSAAAGLAAEAPTTEASAANSYQPTATNAEILAAANAALEAPATVRRGYLVLEAMQLLPEGCEIVYKNLTPRADVIQRREATFAAPRKTVTIDDESLYTDESWSEITPIYESYAGGTPLERVRGVATLALDKILNLFAFIKSKLVLLVDRVSSFFNKSDGETEDQMSATQFYEAEEMYLEQAEDERRLAQAEGLRDLRNLDEHERRSLSNSVQLMPEIQPDLADESLDEELIDAEGIAYTEAAEFEDEELLEPTQEELVSEGALEQDADNAALDEVPASELPAEDTLEEQEIQVDAEEGVAEGELPELSAEESAASEQDAAEFNEAAQAELELEEPQDLETFEQPTDVTRESMEHLVFSAEADSSEDELVEKDSSGLDTLSVEDIEDLNSRRTIPEERERPAAITAPGWGTSDFKPSQRLTTARRTALSDLPDPMQHDLGSTDGSFNKQSTVALRARMANLPSPLDNPLDMGLVSDAESTFAKGVEPLEAIPSAEEQATEVKTLKEAEPLRSLGAESAEKPQAAPARSSRQTRPSASQKPEKPKRRLFGGRKKNQQEEESLSSWLGVNSDFDAKKDGREIGSWENFSDDKGTWKGGATYRSDLREEVANEWYGEGWDTPQEDELLTDEAAEYAAEHDASEHTNSDEQIEELREAILSMSDDELLAHDIWFVGLGASVLDHAGMTEFLDAHRRDVRGCFLINLDSVGAGQLTMLTSEGIATGRRADRRIGRLMLGVAEDLHIDLARESHSWESTDATQALKRSMRVTTLMGISEDGVRALSRTVDDEPEFIDDRQIADVADIVTEVIRRS